ncbi:MAG: MaoC/PaaZ C-terminal domain-containing protein, partial [Pseudomonadota bacterium]
PGRVLPLAPISVGAADIREFAAAFDPQPVHLDEIAARNTLLGGLSASGWHVSSLVMRMICDGFLLETASMGSPGIEDVRWLAPVRPDDRLTGTGRVIEARLSRRRPSMGIAIIEYDVYRETETPVFFARCTHLLRTRMAKPTGHAS